MKVHAYRLSEQQIVEHFATMEKKFKRHTGELFFPSLNYTLDLIESGDKLKSLKTEVENMVLFVGLGIMPVKLSVSKLNNAVAVINIANKTLGIVSGVAVGLFLVRVFMAVVDYLSPSLCEGVIEDINSSTVLGWVHEHNFVSPFVNSFLKD